MIEFPLLWLIYCYTHSTFVLCSVIVSQWTGMLNIMQYHLDLAGISHVRIDGS